MNVLDITSAGSRFGWSPRVTLRDGIRKTWEWIRGSGYAR